MLELKDGSWIVTINLVWGPFPCEHKEDGCGGDSFAFILTREEYDKIKVKSGSKMVRCILDNKLGEVICDSCLEKKIAEVGGVSPS